MSVRHTTVDSPVGPLTLVAEGDTLIGLYFEDHGRPPRLASLGPRVDEGFEEAARQLREYFAGEREGFDLLVELRGSDFERQVWSMLAEIPRGETRTYGQLAAELGGPNAARAVGRANGQNPLSVIVPCHRVVGADGALTGYAGGIERKKALLDLERRPASSLPAE
ncbi:methylated-DNA--[protein]-cysteine S-methyltransferase [Streptomyces sp. NPDC093675]|uniref:methylated-DNA--[protein]-cysteine S-methyltransferase n=1 Tax=Streptomyces sp. NPDC093675 TaxID=3366049 RepID=UPI0037F4AF5C